jgi:hypothetical protein
MLVGQVVEQLKLFTGGPLLVFSWDPVGLHSRE